MERHLHLRTQTKNETSFLPGPRLKGMQQNSMWQLPLRPMALDAGILALQESEVRTSLFRHRHLWGNRHRHLCQHLRRSETTAVQYSFPSTQEVRCNVVGTG